MEESSADPWFRFINESLKAPPPLCTFIQNLQVIDEMLFFQVLCHGSAETVLAVLKV